MLMLIFSPPNEIMSLFEILYFFRAQIWKQIIEPPHFSVHPSGWGCEDFDSSVRVVFMNQNEGGREIKWKEKENYVLQLKLTWSILYIFTLIFVVFFLIDLFWSLIYGSFVCFIPRRDETMKSNKMRNEKQYTNGTKKSKQQQNF